MIDGTRVLLVRRGAEPLKGEWSIPGGMLELGEELPAAVVRELREETGLDVEPLDVIAVFDRIERDGRSKPKYHYVIVDYVCRKLGGRLAPSSDVEDARWVEFRQLRRYHLTAKANEVIREAFRHRSGKRR